MKKEASRGTSVPLSAKWAITCQAPLNTGWYARIAGDSNDAHLYIGGCSKPELNRDTQGQCMETKEEETCTLVEGVDNNSGSNRRGSEEHNQCIPPSPCGRKQV